MQNTLTQRSNFSAEIVFSNVHNRMYPQTKYPRENKQTKNKYHRPTRTQDKQVKNNCRTQNNPKMKFTKKSKKKKKKKKRPVR
jgi:hypothetical protein